MAFGTTTVFEVETGGSDSNGGGFDPGNASMATDLTATSATGSSPVVSSASYNFASRDVGAWVFIKSGTNWIDGWYQIASVASNQATLTASIGSALLYDGGLNAASSTVAGCATAASPSGGTWSIDYSKQTAAGVAFTDLVIDGTTNTKCTSAGNPFGKNFVGNIINVTSGTGFTVQRVEVSSVTGTAATCDKSLGTLSSTGGHGNIGGCLGSPGQAGGLVTSSGRIWIKSGTYTLTSSSANASAGPVSINPGGAGLANPGVMEGYGTFWGDLGTQPTIAAGSITSITICTIAAGGWYLRNITCDGASGTSVQGVSLTSALATADRVNVKNCTNNGFTTTVACTFIRCTATGCSTQPAFATTGACEYVYCEAYGNTITGFSNGATSTLYVSCISSSNSGASSDGFASSGTIMGKYVACVSYGNGRDGFHVTERNSIFVCCVTEANSGYGWNAGAGAVFPSLQYCAAYNNTSGAVNSITGYSNLALNTTGTFFVNAGSGNFAPNAIVNQGALLKAAGFPGVMPRGTTTGYQDIGIQHQDSVGGGGLLLHSGMTGGIHG